MKIILACGGTGGHIFPGVALAQAFEKRVEGVEVVFVGTKRGLEQRVIGKTNWRLEMIDTPSFADKKGLKKLKTLFVFGGALGRAGSFLKREKPNLVIGVGGYVAAPLLLMASLMKIPTLTIEPNAIPGLANRLLKYFVDEVVVPYPGMEKYFGKKTRPWGVPVREDLLRDASLPTSKTKKGILIFGGSQGAKTINEGLLKALPSLSDLKEKIRFVHQIGFQADQKVYEGTYQYYGFEAKVFPFIENMGAFYREADFVIARSGANTVAELIALRKPSLLIPYPFSQASHQEANARFLQGLGGAEVLLDEEMKGDTLAEKIRQFVQEPQRLGKMSLALAKLEGGKATEMIVEECWRMVMRNA